MTLIYTYRVCSYLVILHLKSLFCFFSSSRLFWTCVTASYNLLVDFSSKLTGAGARRIIKIPLADRENCLSCGKRLSLVDSYQQLFFYDPTCLMQFTNVSQALESFFFFFVQSPLFRFVSFFLRKNKKRRNPFSWSRPNKRAPFKSTYLEKEVEREPIVLIWTSSISTWTPAQTIWCPSGEARGTPAESSFFSSSSFPGLEIPQVPWDEYLLSPCLALVVTYANRIPSVALNETAHCLWRPRLNEWVHQHDSHDSFFQEESSMEQLAVPVTNAKEETRWLWTMTWPTTTAVGRDHPKKTSAVVSSFAESHAWCLHTKRIAPFFVVVV